MKKYIDMNINERINLKSWYKHLFPKPWALVSVMDTERAGDNHYKSWMEEPVSLL